MSEAGLPPRASSKAFQRQQPHAAGGGVGAVRAAAGRLQLAPSDLPGHFTPSDINKIDFAGSIQDFNAKQQARLELSDEDRALLAAMDPEEKAPLIQFLCNCAPGAFGDNFGAAGGGGSCMTAAQAEDFLDMIIHGGNPSQDAAAIMNRRRGMSRWGNLRRGSRVFHSGSGLDGALPSMMLTGGSPSSVSRRASMIGFHETGGSLFAISGGLKGLSSGSLGSANDEEGEGDDTSNNASSNSALHGTHMANSGRPLTAAAAVETKHEAAFEEHLQMVANGVQRIDERHRERTLRLRLANRDVYDIASQVIGSRGARVVTTTGRPPPSSAVDAVGGIKQEMKVTHGEPPLMVLRQELEDRRALAAAMPRIRARVAEIMGKLQKQQNSRPGLAGTPSSASRSRQRRPNSAATPSLRSTTPLSYPRPSPAAGNFSAMMNSNSNDRRMSEDHDEEGQRVGRRDDDNSRSNNKNNSPPPPGTAGGVAYATPHSSPPRGRSDRTIAEIASRLKLRSQALREQAEKMHEQQMDKRRAASTLRRELVSQGIWVDVRILSMFRPPAQAKVFVSSWTEFRSMVVQAVSPLPPGCSFSALSYISGVGAKSIIDPRHPLLRPLRSFDQVRACKTRDGTSASLTVSIAIRSGGDGIGVAPDGFVV